MTKYRPPDSTAEPFLSTEYWTLFLFMRRWLGERTRESSELFRSQFGSEMEIGCELHPEISSNTGNGRLQNLYPDGKDYKQYFILENNWVCIMCIFTQKVKILRHLRDNLVQIWLTYRGRNWGPGRGVLVVQLGLEAGFLTASLGLLLLPHTASQGVKKWKIQSANWLCCQTINMNNIFWLNQLSV